MFGVKSSGISNDAKRVNALNRADWLICRGDRHMDKCQ